MLLLRKQLAQDKEVLGRPCRRNSSRYGREPDRALRPSDIISLTVGGYVNSLARFLTFGESSTCPRMENNSNLVMLAVAAIFVGVSLFLIAVGPKLLHLHI